MMANSQTDNRSFAAQAQVFKVLTHPARLAILEILRDGEHCVCHMEAFLGYRQAFISQHLAVLREAGLIFDRRDGWNIFYRVADPGIYAVLDSVRMLTGQPESVLKREGVNCPCPHCKSQAVQGKSHLVPEKGPSSRNGSECSLDYPEAR